MSYSNYQLNQKINNLQQQINNIPPPSGDQNLESVLTVGNNAGGLSITNLNDLGVSTINGSAYPPVIPTDTLTSVLLAGNSAGASNIDMNNNDILAVDNINLTTINNSVYPPATPSLQEVINVSDVLNGDAPLGGQFIGYNGSTPYWSDLPVITLDNVVNESPDLDGSPPTTNQVIQYDGEFVVWADLPVISTPSLQEVITVNDELQSIAPTLNQVIQYNGTHIVWNDLPVPVTPTLSSVLSAGNTASGTSASISLTNLPKQTIISPTSVFLNDTTIVQQATLNTEKLRLLTSGLTNDITSSKMSIIKPDTSSISEYGTDGLSLTGVFGGETRSGGFNLTSGATINNATTKLSGTMNEAFISLDGNTTSSALGSKSTLNASGLTLLNKATPTTTSSLTTTALNIGNSSSTLTASPTGLSSNNILNLNSSIQIDTNCPIRVLAVPPSSAGRAILSNGQLSIQNVTPAFQNTISSTSSAITNGSKTLTMTVNGISSTGAMSLGTATVNLTSGSTGITQTYPSDTTALATTQYVTTAINNIPAATPTLQSVTNQGNTITNGTKTLTLNVNGLDSTGEIAINNNTGTTRIRGTSTIDNINSTNYDTNATDLTNKLLNSLITGNLEIGNNMTTGSINFGSKMTSGNLFIMNDALATGDITMFNNSSSATGKLKVRGGGIQTKDIEASSGIKSLKYNGLSALSDLDFGDNIVNKTISIGRLLSTGGIVSIGTGLSDINLLAINSTAITQTTGNNSNRIATTAFVNSSISAITPPATPSLQSVLNAGNTSNETIILSDGIITNTYTNNSIIGNDNLTINSAPTKLLKIGSGSATENVKIATHTGRSVVLHLGDGINNIAGSGVHINNGSDSVGNTQINNASGQTGQINIGNATSGNTTTNMKGNTNIEGIVNINGVGSTNTGLITIGNATAGGITTLRNNTINIQNETQINNTRQITIGATTGLFDSNTTLAGKTTINKLTLGTAYNPSYDYPIAGSGLIGYLITGVNISPLSYTNSALKTMSTISLTKGIWILTSFSVTNPLTLSSNYFNNSFTTGTNGTGTIISANDISVQTGHTGKNTNTVVYSTNSSIDIYYNYGSNNSSSLASIRFTAYRIA